MSVHTTCDEYIEQAREAVRLADEALAEAVMHICIKDSFGADQWTDVYKLKLRQASFEMHNIREVLA